MLFSSIATLSLLPLPTLSAPSHSLRRSPHAHASHQRRQIQVPGLQIPEPPLISSGSPSSSLPEVPGTTAASTSAAKPLLMTYYADWAPPQHQDYTRYDVVIFAFALPDSNFSLAWDTDTAPGLLKKLVSDAHAQSCSVILSVGGWTGSEYFSSAVSTAQNREEFVSNILAAYMHYNLDGIDIDWEYPGQSGDSGNQMSSSDTANMLEFFKVLREKLPPTAKISAAVQDTPFEGADHEPIKDASGFAKLLDFVTLMNYDDFETSNPPGPNAPLYNGCGNSTRPGQDAAGGYDAWSKAGFPSNKIVLGVPAYGYIITSDATRLRQRSYEVKSVDGSGQIQFSDLTHQGVLTRNADGTFAAGEGFTREWDSCSATPFLRSDRQVIPYDDPDSLGLKAAFVRKMGMGGVNLFDMHGDTADFDLTNALRKNLMVPTAGAASSPTTSSLASPV